VITIVSFAEFRNREGELRNAFVASKSKARDLEISLREAEARGEGPGAQMSDERSY
jgi:hypothetical protein